MWRKMAFILCVAACSVMSHTALAWGPIGHRVVGEIAWEHLTPKARVAVQKILGNESLALSSTWADFIRSDSNYKYLTPWHYIDFEGEMEASAMPGMLKKDTSVNAYTRLRFIISELGSSRLSQDKKRLYLRMLVHIVGDLHQPLHVSPRGDHGANAIKVNWFKEESNLHRVWDEQIIDYQQLSYTEYTRAINFVTPLQKAEWQKDAIEKWLIESYALSKSIRAELNGEIKLGYVYNFKNINTVNQQLLKAGVRLAGILNKLFV